MSEDKWYFAYGSNMSVDRKEERTGKIRSAERCHLDGFRLTFNKRADVGGVYANIVPDETSEVWGVLYLCDQLAMKTLDEKEGVANGHYERTTIQVVNSKGEPIECETYVAGLAHICKEETPSPDYLSYLLAGARDHDLPKWYIDLILELGKQKSS
jgi:gamma-glutamylcyclotransferase (GGCT)/AIG2-like uncharacterized protein YtfP